MHTGPVFSDTIQIPVAALSLTPRTFHINLSANRRSEIDETEGPPHSFFSPAVGLDTLDTLKIYLIILTYKTDPDPPVAALSYNDANDPNDQNDKKGSDYYLYKH